METAMELAVASVVSELVSWAISIVLYVLQALGLYTIAKRRGIPNPWMAWVPVASLWLIGHIADHYRQVTRGEKKNRRTALLVLSLSVVVICVLFVILTVAMFLNAGFGEFSGPSYDLSYGAVSDDDMAIVGMFGLLIILFCFVGMGVSIALIVVQYICLYDIYDSCDPGNKVLYLLLSIFLNLAPIFLFVCRNKDLGMYPRPAPVPVGYPPYPYPQPQYQLPQYHQPQYQAPQYQAPRYQQPQYQAPRYQAPQYQAPQYQAPQYQMPQPQTTQQKPEEETAE